MMLITRQKCLKAYFLKFEAKNLADVVQVISLRKQNLSSSNDDFCPFTIPTLLLSITNVAPGGSVNQIAVFTSN
jgi:hypothetical protein